MRQLNPDRLARRRFLILAALATVVVAAAACGATNQQDTTGGAGASSGSSGSGAQGSVSSSGAGGEDSATTGFNPTAGSGTGGAGGCGGPPPSECEIDIDCDDGDATTTDACIIVNPGAEFPHGACVHVPCDGPDCTGQSVDPTCSAGDDTVVYPAFTPLVPPGVPASCANGFQLTDAAGAPSYVLHSMKPSGSQALTLDLDFATYTAPDGILITGIDGNCQPYVLFDSCRLKTADQPFSAYGNGMERPDDIAIRQFDLTLRAGTTELTFDFSRVTTPMYLQVLGLCDFDLPPATGVKWFAPVP